jgi:cell division transport system ATP-binding protein
MNPRTLLADEPTGNLDAELTKEIKKLLKIHQRLGTTIVIATQDKNLLNFNPTK